MAAHINSGWISRTVKVIEQTVQHSSQPFLGLFVRHNKDRLEIDRQAKPDQHLSQQALKAITYICMHNNLYSTKIVKRIRGAGTG